MTDDDLEANYREAYDNRIGFGKKPALILIDFVEAYFDPACALYAGVDDALASALRVRAAARRKGVPVIYTNVVYHPLALNGGRFYQKARPLENFLAGCPMGAWPQGVAPAEDELVVSKQYPSAFFGTSLAYPDKLGHRQPDPHRPDHQRLRARHLCRHLLARFHSDRRS